MNRRHLRRRSLAHALGYQGIMLWQSGKKPLGSRARELRETEFRLKLPFRREPSPAQRVPSLS